MPASGGAVAVNAANTTGAAMPPVAAMTGEVMAASAETDGAAMSPEPDNAGDVTVKETSLDMSTNSSSNQPISRRSRSATPLLSYESRLPESMMTSWNVHTPAPGVTTRPMMSDAPTVNAALLAVR
jgi:hypothetical protein